MEETIKVHRGCGCVFCDLGLKPDTMIYAHPVHMHQGKGIGYSFCAAVETPPLPAPSVNEE